MSEARSPSESPSPAPADGAELSFEAALERLGAVVDRLEDGDLELEVALASFEEGVRLSRRCNEQLDTAQQRIEVLMKQGEEWIARPFDEDSERADDGREIAEDSDDDLADDPEQRG